MAATATSSHPLRTSAAALLLCGACTLPTLASAAVVITLAQSPAGVQVIGSGTLNTAGLTLMNTTPTAFGITAFAAFLTSGIGSDLTFYRGVIGTIAFGSGSFMNASGGAGSFLGIAGNDRYLLVPPGYVSGTALTTSSNYAGATFASLGFVPGTYTRTWGSGVNADSFTIQSVIVPEPSTWALALGGAGLLGLVARRRRGVAR